MKANEPSLQRKYLLLSHLMGRGQPEEGIHDRVRLERMIGVVVGRGSCAPLHKKTLKSILGVGSLGETCLPLLSLLLRHTNALTNLGTLVLVLDDLSDLRWDELERCAHLVERLLQTGVLVLVLEPAGKLTSLAAFRDVLTTNDFIRIYLNDLWQASRSLLAPQLNVPGYALSER